MSATFSLAGYTLGKPDVNGVMWHPMIEGWDAPNVRSEQFTVPGVHGASPGEWLYDPRALVLSGVADCPTELEMWTTMDRLAQLADATEAPVELRVATALRTLACQVLRAGKLDMKPLTDTLIDFSLPLTALDPRKYAVTESSAGATASTFTSFTINAAGSVKRVPILRVVAVGGSGGAPGGFRLRNNTDDTGTFLVYNHPITAGETVTFDFPTQSAISSASGWVTPYVPGAAVWHDLLRGSNAIDVWTDSGTVTGTVYWKDGWI